MTGCYKLWLGPFHGVTGVQTDYHYKLNKAKLLPESRVNLSPKPF